MVNTGNTKIKSLYIGNEKIKKATIGENLIFGETKPSRLPEGYTEVEYIHFDGIYTSFKLSETILKGRDKFFFKFFIDKESDSSINSRYLFLLSTKRNSLYDYIFFNYKGFTSYNYAINVTSNMKKTIDISDNLLEFNFDFANSKYKINQINLTGYSNSNEIGSYSKFIGSHPDASNGANSAMGKFYQFTHYRDGEIIHDYVPCTNPSSIAGLYDINNEIFIQNINTKATTITPGPAI